MAKDHSRFMFWIMIFVLFISLMALAYERSRAADVSLFIACIDNPSESGSPRVWFGYEASETVEGSGWFGAVGDSDIGYMQGAPNTLNPGRHERAFGAEIVRGSVIWQFLSVTGELWEISADGTGNAPSCAEADAAGTGRPDGGIQTVTLAVGGQPGDCYTWEIQDEYGHWSAISGATRYQNETGDAFTRLALGADNPVTDAARYRIFAATCPN